MNKYLLGKCDCLDVIKNPSAHYGQIYAIIPAAGKGQRYGKPKIEATYGQKSFIKYILDTLSRTPVAGVKVVRNVETPGMLSTIKMGIECALNDGWNAQGWLIWPIDHPLVEVKTVISLIREFWQSPDAVVNPLYEGNRGHPLIIPVSMEIPESDIDGGLREVIRQTDVKMVDVTVPDHAVLKNINYEEDLIGNV